MFGKKKSTKSTLANSSSKINKSEAASKKTVKSNRPKYRYIAMVRTNNGGWVHDWSEGKDGHSLSSSGRWTDAKMRSSKKEAAKVADQLASGFSKSENAKAWVRSVKL